MTRRTWRFREYASCLVGVELVNYLVNSAQCKSREDAVALCQRMETMVRDGAHQRGCACVCHLTRAAAAPPPFLPQGYLRHVTGEHKFEDAVLFYRVFDHPDPSIQRRARRRSSVAQARRQEEARAGTAATVKLGTVPEPSGDTVATAAAAARASVEGESEAESGTPGVAVPADRLPTWARGLSVSQLLTTLVISGWMVKQGHRVRAGTSGCHS